MSTVAYVLSPVRSPHGGLFVNIYTDGAGIRTRVGQIEVPWQHYAALARMVGQEPVAADKVPTRADSDLATAIAADAAEALRGVSLHQAEQELVDDWNRTYPKPGQRVLWRPMTNGDDEECDPDSDVATTTTTRTRAFVLGGIAVVWLNDWAMPVSLAFVQPLRDRIDR